MSVIVIGGWKAEPREGGGFWIIDRRGQFRGYAPSEASAREWLDESSGEAYKRLPALKLEQLTIKSGKQNRLYFPHGWYRHTQYFYGDKLLGYVQVRSRSYGGREKIDTLTLVADHCVIGRDLRWMLKENGYRLED